MTTINQLDGVIVGEYGIPCIITIVDLQGVAINVSTYTGTMTVSARDPLGITTLSLTGSFVTDGSDGKVQFQPTSTVYFDRAGDWDAQVKLTKTGVVGKTYPFIIHVKESIS